MKPITFENLRRLVGGGRKKKDRAESSFKRSDSFKRISIRKNYLDRGGKGRNPLKATRPEKEVQGGEPLVIGYGQWIRCVHAEDYGRAPTPPPRKKHGSSADSSLEIVSLEKSPVPVRRRFRPSPPPTSRPLESKDERSDSALSVSLGRIWMDAPLAMANAPRSLELPRPSSSVEADPNGRRAHHSLESALKDKRDDVPGGRQSRFHNYPTPPVQMIPPAICRTLSSTTQTNSTSKTLSSRGSTELLSSSKDSGFSFSISIPRLTDFSPPRRSGGGFFRKKKSPVKPKPSVSRDGYFKRTSAVRVANSGSVSSKRGSSSGAGGGTARSDLYQVVIGRPPRSLRSLKLDPMIFVPPEKRSMRRVGKYEVQEIREYCNPRDLRVADPTEADEDEGLYECISEPDIEPEREDDIIEDREYENDNEDDANELDDIDNIFEDDYDDDNEEENCVQRRPVRRRKSRKAVKYLAKPSIHRAPSTLKRNIRKKCQ